MIHQKAATKFRGERIILDVDGVWDASRWVWQPHAPAEPGMIHRVQQWFVMLIN